MNLFLFLLCLSLSANLACADLADDHEEQDSELSPPHTGIITRQPRSTLHDINLDCQEGDPLGVSYTGSTNSTASGRTCQVWSASQPHVSMYPELGEHNYCRNPDRTPYGGVWCHTTDPDKFWEHCSVPICASNSSESNLPTDNDLSADNDQEHQRSNSSQGDHGCQEGDPLGANYLGTKNVTASGIPCQTWADTQPHEHSTTDLGEHNHCRNPDEDPEGVWCYTTDPDKRWEHCSVPICASTSSESNLPTDNDLSGCQGGDPLGAIYLGKMNVTASGIPCQTWTDNHPHEHAFTDLGEHNHCRNPDEDPEGVWCFTTDPDKRWEYCSVPICVPNGCQVGDPLGASYLGTTNFTASGWTCQFWTASQQSLYPELGEHNYCRNPDGDSEGVWCQTTDPNKEWEHCSVPICTLTRVLDFSADNDGLPDNVGEYTSATLEIPSLPESFTVCSAFMVDAWNSSASARMFTLFDVNFNEDWLVVMLSTTHSSREYYVRVNEDWYNFQDKQRGFFPLQWTRVCLSLSFDRSNDAMMLVVDGILLQRDSQFQIGETFYFKKPENLNLIVILGQDPVDKAEKPGKIGNFNVFSNALTKERMEELTRAGAANCGTPGDFLNWEEAEWSLHSKARMTKVDLEWEGPCRRESKVQVFTFNDGHHDCMRHCQKISNGRTPPVLTKEQWKNFTQEVNLITQHRANLPELWLSATEGDKGGNKLHTLSHWPDQETVDNRTIDLKAKEGVWRDYYSGERLQDRTIYAYAYGEGEGKGEGDYGEDYNCMRSGKDSLNAYTYIYMHNEDTHTDIYTFKWWESWGEVRCLQKDMGCPCSYPAPPLLRLRGLCSESLIDRLFTPKQLPGNPRSMIILGQTNTRIEYDDASSQWELTDAKSGVTAVSKASKSTYLLGKHNWTISNDECNEGKTYATMLMLTGCKEEGEFTCDDGQCIKMEKRCNHMFNCRDLSDERDCQILWLEDGYNTKVPPFSFSEAVDKFWPAQVKISITLMKVVEIEERDHSIHLQFQISLKWKEPRAIYHNLKKDTTLNDLSANISDIWLPLVIYDNTDQKEVTRLGVDWEWITTVAVTREEENPDRSELDKVHEAEIFQGNKSILTMNQTYTWEFQCKYRLKRYPFDTQVFEKFTKIVHFIISQECKIKMTVDGFSQATVNLIAGQVSLQFISKYHHGKVYIIYSIYSLYFSCSCE